jgi:hypothetical protein
MTEEFITIVSGLPRSGTSMMMQMLEAGGIPALKDDIREADTDNPRGYYEFERVKQVAHDQAWLPEEILASQKVMLNRRNQPADKVSDEQMASLFRAHLKQIEKWLQTQPNMQVLYINYNDMVADPRPQVERLAQFLSPALDREKMMVVVDRTLYRERK